ncbi:MAG: nucleoside/nucleotide kinase family protein [Pseudobutyrivibrio sp.]|nr:nucleoside/nucleotide kinase family protein [Pseudobutyrivibrio sp.]
MDYNVEINGLLVNAQYNQRTINEIFLPLLKDLTELYHKKRERILVMLAAPPGAGKSTLLSFLEYLSKNNPSLEEIQAIGMDGFHHYQDYLLNHTIELDGEVIPMVKINGAPITFDLDKLRSRVKQIKEKPICKWPIYDRNLHNPIDNVITIDKNIVLLEGNYLLLNEDGWCDLSNYADYTIFLSGDEDMLYNRLVERKARTVATLEEAKQFVEYSDMRNVRTVLNYSMPANLTLHISADGDYSS